MRFPHLLLLLLATSAASAVDIPLEIPQPVDPRLEVTLYASDPEIVTPIGAAVDPSGRLFVIESHTHLRPTNYSGPQHDLIKIFEGVREDGRAAKVSVFSDNIDEAMNLAFSPDGTLYACTAKQVLALPDVNGDNRADGHTVILQLETEQSYPHSQLLGLTFSPDGWLYATRGNLGGYAYAWVGSDGTRLEGYGEGGDIVRCRPDGTKLERVAQGFWNPFDVRFDRFGRLLCVDNDPDSRGPNRLLHIVPGGDYGFRTLYGSSGLHPYNAWEGDLPGTLPLMSGLGEAPSAVLDLSFSALPVDYRDTVIATIWGEHNVTLFRTRPEGVSLRATAEPFLRGGKYFRPVALAPAPEGAVFITDWMISDYPNHGRGRIWRLTTKAGVVGMKPTAPFAAPERNEAFVRFETLRAATQPEQFEMLRSALTDLDPFVRSAALDALARPVYRSAITGELENANPSIRLGALLALRRAGLANPTELLKARLADPDPEVRQMALMWTGERVLTSLRPAVEAAIALPIVTPRLFETWLATIALLDSNAAELYAKRVPGFRIMRTIPPSLIERLVADPRLPASIRALAIPRLGHLDRPENHALLVQLARSTEPQVQIEALRGLSTSSRPETAPVLRQLALDQTQASSVRAEALLTLGGHTDASILPLLDDPDAAVRMQTARALRFAMGDPKVRGVVARKLASVARDPADAALTNQLEFLLNETPSTPRPVSVEGWQKLLATGGDVEAGHRVFFSPMTACAQCHRVEGRGGQIGPDLSVVGRTADRNQLIHSIVKPSDDIAPQFQGWEVKKKNGELITGLQGHLRTGGAVSIISLDGQELLVPPQQVATFGAMTASLMPEGLPSLLSAEEFRDLVAFLAAQK